LSPRLDDNTHPRNTSRLANAPRSDGAGIPSNIVADIACYAAAQWDGDLGPVVGYIGGFREWDGSTRRAVWLANEPDGDEPLSFNGDGAA